MIDALATTAEEAYQKKGITLPVLISLTVTILVCAIGFPLVWDTLTGYTGILWTLILFGFTFGYIFVIAYFVLIVMYLVLISKSIITGYNPPEIMGRMILDETSVRLWIRRVS